ncbi:MAG TPA: undecaprenyl-phosphate glucose phosphotransferase [Thiobacillaceae bacterium]|nr:undecaprenyl-phosphate glucose phosphotransferase [Thiobacillaceae bacterium]HNA82344.1 undecaprenyl-phosphate glucose phosphotransferase [Thiobacillaceae bacterium]HNF88398.1 undecaprenyl-phosphate glucose phosphotransferase [Thiobacillaceae bacterium]HNH88023.1 undecaprenyl-phosphate glucose phosphotransferase [Thiobacillaceae bacterium]HNI07262.1 undecaprenyl-phosphate glucose phosphotransferase [Thiobacillaceae bacterium]
MYFENATLALVRRLTHPLGAVLVLVAVLAYYDEPLDGYYIVLSIIVFFLSANLFDDLSILRPCGRGRLLSGIGSVLFAWMLTVGALLFLAYVTHLESHFYEDAIVAWFLITPIVLVSLHFLTRAYVHNLHSRGQVRRAIIVGGNEVGLRLAVRLEDNECLLAECLGFFDDRRKDRLHPDVQARHLGQTRELMDYIKAHRVDVIYISLPLSQKDRIAALMDMLKDSTASIYVVPDVFTYDLIQARIDQIGGIPVIAILETPFTSINAFNKRMLDVLLSLTILVLISPLLLLIALAVRLDSPGPVIFRQRRYGLNGEEIIVYKFRSMTVCEDAGDIRQATRGDSRITRLGAFLRRTSLDELPQFINVIQGRMSIVGPRPHAVAHNELYRKQIAGYMLRHKVKPGITGWAQVNGYRGETESVDKMAARVQFDLDYLRNWSLSLDLLIVFKTIWLVFKDARAY